MDPPHRTAGGTITESPLVLIDVTLADGTIGHAIVFTYTRAALVPTAELVRNIAASIEGGTAEPREVEQMLAARFRLLGTQGLVGMALAGIDMALWDAKARQHNGSLIDLMGGINKEIVAYGAVGYDGEKESARVAEAWAKQGFAGVKAKIGYATVVEDVRVIRAMRSAVGPSVEIMIDYNQTLTPQQAIQRLKVLDQENLTWVEEPTLAHDYAGHALITRNSNTPVQCGENWWGTLDLQHAMDAGASDYIMPDVMKIGGVSGWMHAVDMAQPRGYMISSHLWPEVSAQLLALTPTAHRLEYSTWWNAIVADPLQIEKGKALTQGVMGTGVEWDEVAVCKYLV